MILVKEPVPLPFVMWLSTVVGSRFVLQQTPRAVTGSPLSEITLPPDEAVVRPMFDGEVVVTAGIPNLE